MKNPPLSLVLPGATNSEPPRKLGRHGRKLWDTVQHEYGIHDVGGVELLAQAAGVLDLIEALSAAIERDGSVVYGRNGPKSHPAVKDLIGARALSGAVAGTSGHNRRGHQAHSRPADEPHRLDRRMTCQALDASR